MQHFLIISVPTIGIKCGELDTNLQFTQAIFIALFFGFYMNFLEAKSAEKTPVHVSVRTVVETRRLARRAFNVNCSPSPLVLPIRYPADKSCFRTHTQM